MRRALLTIALVTFVALLSGCQVRSTIKVDTNSNGSGTVSVIAHLDKSALHSVPDLKSQLQSSDLTKAGWNINGPDNTDDGGATITASHGFSSPEEANALFRQMSGNGPPFENFQLTQSRSLQHVNTTFNGTVDLRQGVNSFGDLGLTQSLGSRLGFDPNELASALSIDWSKTFPVDVVVNMPGTSTIREPATDKTDTWHASYAAASTFHATASGVNKKPIMYFGMAAAFLVACVALLMLWDPKTYNPLHGKGVPGIRARDLLRLDDTEHKPEDAELNKDEDK